MNPKTSGILPVVAAFFFLASCHSIRKIHRVKIYQPPALGAEYQFDRGLPSTRHPKQLFDPKMDKYFTQKGMTVPEMGRHSGKPTVSVQKTTVQRPADSLHHAGNVTDSLHHPVYNIKGDSLSVKKAVPATTSPLHPGNPVSPDSSHTVQR